MSTKITRKPSNRITVTTLLALLLAVCCALFLAGCGGPWAAKVNGEKIYESQVQGQLDDLVKESPKIFDGADGEGRRLDYRDQILNILIDEALVKQRAAELKVTVSSTQISEKIQSLRGDMTNTMWAKALESAGYTEETLESFVKTQLLTDKLIEKEQAAKPVTDAEIASYYENNKKQFLIKGTENDFETLAEAKEKIRSMIQEQRRSDVYTDMMDKWRKAAKIEIAQVSEETVPAAETK